jgi:hypothetical protein
VVEACFLPNVVLEDGHGGLALFNDVNQPEGLVSLAFANPELAGFSRPAAIFGRLK